MFATLTILKTIKNQSNFLFGLVDSVDYIAHIAVVDCMQDL